MFLVTCRFSLSLISMSSSLSSWNFTSFDIVISPKRNIYKQKKDLLDVLIDTLEALEDDKEIPHSVNQY